MKVDTLIAGGGLAGLSCARELHDRSQSYLLIEKQKSLGGLCRTIMDRGFTFDYTGHFLHFHKPELRQWARRFIGKSFKSRRRHAVIHSHGAYSEYPYQENNAGLPSSVAKENVLGYLEAQLHQRADPYYGGNRTKAFPRGSASSNRGPRLEASAQTIHSSENFKQWCVDSFGHGISKNFMFPYNQKLWKFPLNKMSTHWMGRFVPSPKVKEVVEGALSQRSSDSGYNATFLYPDRGGISVLPEAVGAGLPSLWRGASLQRLDLNRRQAHLESGFTIDYKNLVSSLPLPQLVRLTRGLPSGLQRAAGQLKATSIYNINLGLKGAQPIPYSWVYFPEARYQFHRAGSVSACVPTAAPQGHFSLYVEFSYRGAKPNAAQLGKHAVGKLKELGWIRSEKQIVTRVDLDLPGAYVIYDEHRESVVGEILAFYRKKGVHSIGRYGQWEYGSMESALEQGIRTAQTLAAV